MSLQRFEPIYRRLPSQLQQLACWLYGWNFVRRTYGPRYFEIFNGLLESDRWSSSEIEAYQNQQIKSLVSESYENVLYYREVMDRLHLRPSDFKTVADLHKLPVLRKEDVRNNAHKFVSRKSSTAKLLFRHTSGTTGKSLHFYVNKETDLTQWAIWWRQRNRFGMTLDSWHVNFGANLLIPADQNKAPYWRWVKPMRQVISSMQHFTPSKIRAIIDFLNDNHFEFFTGFPSTIHVFAMTASQAGLRLNKPPRIIFLGAENVLYFQRRLLDEFFGSLIIDHYGFSEACGNASKCESGFYHEDFELGILECQDSKSISGNMERGRIIATGFTCHEFPFIRYDVGDIGVWDVSGSACNCGRQSRRLVKVEGREDDYVVTPEGRRLMRFDFLFKDAQNCLEAQVLQEEIGKIKVFIVRRPCYSSKDETQILRELRRWISNRLEVEFVYVSCIEREPSGKFRAVKTSIAVESGSEIPDSCAFPEHA